MTQLLRSELDFEDFAKVPDVEPVNQLDEDKILRGIYLILYRKSPDEFGVHLGHSINVELRMLQHEQSRQAGNEKGIHHRWAGTAEVARRIFTVDMSSTAELQDTLANIPIAEQLFLPPLRHITPKCSMLEKITLKKQPLASFSGLQPQLVQTLHPNASKQLSRIFRPLPVSTNPPGCLNLLRTIESSSLR